MRGPSAYNGIVGLRPTTGMISRDGIAPKNLNFDSAGPMARSVTDMALMLSVIGGKDAADPLKLKVWSEEEKRYPAKNGHIDFTKYLDANALKGKKLGVVRDFFGGDPEIDALAEKALADMRKLGATTVDIKLDAAFVEKYLGDGNRKLRRLSDYRFKADWEQYLATFKDPTLPKTVAAFVKLDEEVVNKSPLPVEESVMRLLKTLADHVHRCARVQGVHRQADAAGHRRQAGALRQVWCRYAGVPVLRAVARRLRRPLLRQGP